VKLFGTNGIREVVGERFTAEFVTSVASAIATVVPPPGPIAVGWDGRTSSPAFARVVGSTLALAGHRVIELGLLPTPAIQYSVPRVGARLAVIVTASHNPPEFNGLKCIGPDGLEVPREVEEAIESGVEHRTARPARYTSIGEIVPDAIGAERYLEGILAQVDVARIAARRFTVVLDAGNGASVVTSPTLLRRLGCRVISLNGHLDGTFPGRPSEPTEATVTDLRRLVPAVGADFGVAHDGDADRAVFVDATGAFVPGESMLAWHAQESVARARGGVVVVPVSASQAVEDAVQARGGSVVYTRVGSPSVTREMQVRSAVFGGEDNGGLVFPKLHLARDGAMSLAATLDLLARGSTSLRDAVATVPRYTMVREKVDCPVELRGPVLESLAGALASPGTKVVTLDGLKVYRDGGWVLLRPSGTEPIFRITAESKEAPAARALADRGVEAVRRAVTELGASRPPTASGARPR
jgi:phosphomannomutase / phosphoglucomutase